MRMRVDRWRLFNSHRIGKAKRFTTAKHPKTLITYLIQKRFRFKMGPITYP